MASKGKHIAHVISATGIASIVRKTAQGG